MSESLAKKRKVDVVEVVRHKGQLMLPEELSVTKAIELLKAFEEHSKQPITLSRDYEAFPFDGAAALQRVLKKKYGWVPAMPTPGFFRDNPPELIAVETSLGVVEQIPWGAFKLPGVEGKIATGYTQKNGKFVFQLGATVLRKFEDEIKALFELVAQELKDHSIYRGKAIRIRFLDDSGDMLPMPEVAFVPTDVKREQLIFSRDLEASIETNLFTPIERALDCKLNGIPVKRGVLLGGMYGCGKTLAAAASATLAVENGITYLYVPRADELHMALAFARQYDDPACVIFCEDIDRVMSGERTTEMDDILNIIDGIDGKRSNIIVVLTTNFLDNINPALLRPGRLDAVINVTPPDAEAVTRLLRAYGGGAISPDEDLSEVGKVLQGNIPATLTEVVKRAKLAQLRLTPPGQKVEHISAAALLEAAKTMKAQIDLLAPPTVTQPDTLKTALIGTFQEALNGSSEAIHETHKLSKRVVARIGA